MGRHVAKPRLSSPAEVDNTDKRVIVLPENYMHSINFIGEDLLLTIYNGNNYYHSLFTQDMELQINFEAAEGW